MPRSAARPIQCAACARSGVTPLPLAYIRPTSYCDSSTPMRAAFNVSLKIRRSRGPSLAVAMGSGLPDGLAQALGQRPRQVRDDRALAHHDLGGDGHAWQQARTFGHVLQGGLLKRDAAQ